MATVSTCNQCLVASVCIPLHFLYVHLGSVSYRLTYDLCGALPRLNSIDWPLQQERVSFLASSFVTKRVVYLSNSLGLSPLPFVSSRTCQFGSNLIRWRTFSHLVKAYSVQLVDHVLCVVFPFFAGISLNILFCHANFGIWRVLPQCIAHFRLASTFGLTVTAHSFCSRRGHLVCCNLAHCDCLVLSTHY